MSGQMEGFAATERMKWDVADPGLRKWTAETTSVKDCPTEKKNSHLGCFDESLAGISNWTEGAADYGHGCKVVAELGEKGMAQTSNRPSWKLWTELRLRLA